MTAEQFSYWLQGFVELGGDMPTEAQWKSIREHLATVFQKVTPPVGDPDALQRAYDDILQCRPGLICEALSSGSGLDVRFC